MARLQLRYLAQVRSGDKGDTADVSLFAPTPALYDVFCREVTAERVKEHFRGLVLGEVRRYEVPKLLALKFVCRRALGGGASSSLRTDNLGKSFGSNLLRMSIEVDEAALAETPLLKGPENE